MVNIANQVLEGFVDRLMDAICVVDTEGRYVYISAAFERIFGYHPQELIGAQMLDLVHPDDRARTLEAAADIMAGNPQLHFENRYLHKSGHVVHVMWSACWSPSDHLRIAVARDITELKRADSLRATLLEISEAANGSTDLACLFERIHKILAGLLGARYLSIVLCQGEPARYSLVYPDDEPHDAARALATEVFSRGRPVLRCDRLGVPLQTASGIIGALLIKGELDAPLYTPRDLDLLQLVSSHVATAIERQQLYERLHAMARYDPLTQLANRTLLNERLQHAVQQADRHGDRLAVLYLDLDKFKQVNDTLGHAAGDALLQEVARRLKACVRAIDTVARIGGDEFVVLLERIHDDADADQVAQVIDRALKAPVLLEGQSWRISSSIGIARYPDDASDLAQLFRHADQAMYAAKKRSRRPG
ncbi:diguanylate cyclase [Pseudomonas sp. LJDD11]|uniref:diguanylate cyclase domain-containing protein n=1 Tax=Pseudomonas sp. LJDD11 TaxID=2931984 RepID=UPI00211C84C4|nr:diguanylate cyclase [Pseudomonas sp. LJDD11]MCQ9426091.1 diguanylate cyclase [Pseudomonas sp. LJDD11]